jgi:hypothetical protein
MAKKQKAPEEAPHTNPRIEVGSVLKFKKFHRSNREDSGTVQGKHWGIVMETIGDEGVPEGMIYTKCPCDDPECKAWGSVYAVIGEFDQYELAYEEDVPEDIPPEFWPLAAQYRLAGE